MNRTTHVYLSLLATLVLIACSITPAVQRPADMWPDCPDGRGAINNATVVIPIDSAAVSTELFHGALVGAFTEDGECIGSTYVRGDKNVSLTVWGTDTQDPNIRGADPGDAFEIRVLNDVKPDITTSAPLVYQHDALPIVITSAQFPGATSNDEITELQDQIDALQAENETLTNERDSARQSRDNLQNQVNSLTAERNDLQGQLADEQALYQALVNRVSEAIDLLSAPL